MMQKPHVQPRTWYLLINIMAYLRHARIVTTEHVPRDYATIDEAVFCSCRAGPRDNYKRMDRAKVRRGHVTASAVTSHVSTVTQQ
jgi:hypothetical protein